MRRKMIMGPALVATLLLTALLPSAASTPVPRWTPQPYRQYLIKLEVERDTITARRSCSTAQKPNGKWT